MSVSESFACWARAVVLAVTPALVLVSCGGGGGSSDGAVSTTASASNTIDVTGGSLRAVNGASVVVPPGALSSPVTIRLAMDSTGAPALPTSAGLQPVGDLMVVTPHSSSFSQPVTLTMPLPAVTLMNNQQFALMQAEPGGSWAVIPSQQSGNNLTAQLTSFSFFQIVVISYPVAVAQIAPLALTTVLTCDGLPCAGTVSHLAHLRLTVTSNGGQLPSVCDANLSWIFADFDAFEQYTGGTLFKLNTYATEINPGGQLPLVNDFVEFPPPPQVVVGNSFFRCLTTQGGMFENNFFSTAQINFSDTGISSADGALRVVDWPTPVVAVAGLPISLRAAIYGGPGVTVHPTPPSVDDQVVVEWQRSDDAGRSWNKVATSNQVDSDSMAYPNLNSLVSSPWIFWAASHGITPTLADNGALFRVKACYTDIHNGKTTPSCVTSAYATLSVLAQGAVPSFGQQPRSVLVTAGQTASLAAQVTAQPSATLQWQTRPANSTGAWSNVASGTGATTGNFTTAVLSTADNGTQFRLLATNTVASTASDVVVVSVSDVNVAPSISTQPASITVGNGGQAVFAVDAVGTEAFSYQWFKGSTALANGSTVSGATSAVLMLTGVSSSDQGNYTVAVSNVVSTVTSNAASLTVTPNPGTVAAPAIVSQPSNSSVRSGQLATFSVGASGSQLSYQWTRNGQPISGANGSSYQLTTSASDNGAAFTALVYNSAGFVFSHPATLTVINPYQVTTLASRTGSTGISLPFWNPFGGITADASGNVYVVDGGVQMGQQIRRFKPDGTTDIFSGSGAIGLRDGPPNTASFLSIQGMATDAAGNIYVADSAEIRKVDTAGNVTTLAGSATQGYVDGPAVIAQFYRLGGIVLDASGNIYVTDLSLTSQNPDCGVRKLSTNGIVSTVSGGNGIGYLDGPGSTAQFNLGVQGEGLGIDTAGVLYLMDPGNHVIRRIATDGTTTTFSGDPLYGGTAPLDGTAASAGFPDGQWLGMDASGNAYVGDVDTSGSAGTGVIRKVSPAGDVTTVVGGNPSGSLDGAGTQAQLTYITALTVAPDGNIYAIDNNTRLIWIRP